MGAELTASKGLPATKTLWPFGSPRVLMFSGFAVPAAIFYMRLSGSYALGTALVVVMLLVYRATLGVGYTHAEPIRLWNAPRISLLVILIIILHLIMSALHMPMDMLRAIGGLVLLMMMLIASAAFAEILLNFPEERIHEDLQGVLLIMLLVAIVGVFGIGPPPVFGEMWRRPFFPFAEPAGFALPFCPFFIYACVEAGAKRRVLLLVFAAVGMAALHAATLALAIGLAAGVTLKKRGLILFGSLSVGVLAATNLTYYTERLDFGSESENLSALVYVQGWQMLVEALENSNLLGLGFQQLGVQGTDVAAAQAIRAMRDGEDLNILDGGFVLAKLGAEFGVFGLLVALALLVRILRSILILRRVARRDVRLSSVEVLAHAIIATFMIHLLARSAGYFTGEVLMTLVALWVVCGGKLRVRQKQVTPAPSRDIAMTVPH